MFESMRTKSQQKSNFYLRCSENDINGSSSVGASSTSTVGLCCFLLHIKKTTKVNKFSFKLKNFLPTEAMATIGIVAPAIIPIFVAMALLSLDFSFSADDPLVVPVVVVPLLDTVVDDAVLVVEAVEEVDSDVVVDPLVDAVDIVDPLDVAIELEVDVLVVVVEVLLVVLVEVLVVVASGIYIKGPQLFFIS